MINEAMIKDNYVDQLTAGKMLNVTQGRISVLCSQGRFNGAMKVGWSWIIPKTSVENFTRLPRGVKAKTAKRTQDHKLIATTLATLQEQETQHDQQ